MLQNRLKQARGFSYSHYWPCIFTSAVAPTRLEPGFSSWWSGHYLLSLNCPFGPPIRIMLALFFAREGGTLSSNQRRKWKRPLNLKTPFQDTSDYQGVYKEGERQTSGRNLYQTPRHQLFNEPLYLFNICVSPGKKMTSASRWRADALLQCRCSDIGAMHRNATGQCGLVILPWVYSL